jgi:hypothetical protein
VAIAPSGACLPVVETFHSLQGEGLQRFQGQVLRLPLLVDPEEGKQ